MSNRTEALTQRLGTLARPSKTPGIQYVAVNASGVLCDYSSGLADLRRQAAMDSATTMMAYSMSKTLTAVATLQLVQHGRIGLDDPVARYVDALPYGNGITVRQLLSHTSGIPNPIPLRWVHAAAGHERFREDDALAAVLRGHARLAFAPGSKYRYSNIGYWLLGQVIERASGEAFTAYMTGHVLRKLGLTDAEMAYVVADPSRHATGYLEKYSFINLIKGLVIDRDLIGEYSGRWLEIRSHYLNGPAFGGLVGTARAFGAFLQDQLRETSALLDGPARRLLYEPQRTSSGTLVAMTLGWHIGARGTTRYFFKEGGGGGFHCLMRLYPDQGVGTVAMSNATAFDVRRCLDTADELFVNR